MHILLLNQYYPPDTSATAPIASDLARALARRHRVTVLAGRPSYDPTTRHGRYLLKREVEGDLAVERVGSTTFSRFGMRGRLINYLTYLSLAVPRALSLRPNLVLSMTDPPQAGIAGAMISRLLRKPFVYNIQDLHPDMALAAGLARPSRWVNLWERLHRWALRKASLVIVPGEDMRDRVVAKGVPREKVVVVRDGATVPEELPDPDNPVSREVRCGFPFTVLHAGNLGFYGAWDTLVDAAKLLGNSDAGFVFVGDGAAKSRIQEKAAGCSRVRFMPFRPADEIPYVLAAGDLHVVTIKRGFEGLVVPSKLYPILAAGRPVAAVAPDTCDAARIVERSGCGIVVDPDDPAGLAQAVQQLAGDANRLKAMGQAARKVAAEYDRKSELERFVDYVEAAA